MRSAELVAKVPTINKNSIYSARERLRTMGYCETGEDRLWRRTVDGERLATGGVIAKEIQIKKARLTMTQENQLDKEAIDINQAIENVALEVALNELRAKLAGEPPIPEQARRVYRAVVEQMPTAIVQALEPISAIVDRP